MTAPAAIAGTFADAKSVKTRSVWQLVIEIPIERADAALAALGGVPQPGRERAVAVALLNLEGGDAASRTGPHGPTPTPASYEPSGPSGGTMVPPLPPEPAPGKADGQPGAVDRVVQRAGILCTESRFREWLRQHLQAWPDAEPTEAWAAEALRLHCGVESRRDLALNNGARKRFLALVEQYEMDTGRRTWVRPDERRSA